MNRTIKALVLVGGACAVLVVLFAFALPLFGVVSVARHNDQLCAELKSIGLNESKKAYIVEWSKSTIAKDSVRSRLGFTGALRNANGVPSLRDFDTKFIGIHPSYLSISFNLAEPENRGTQTAPEDYSSVTVNAGRSSLRIFFDGQKTKVDDQVQAKAMQSFEPIALDVLVKCG